jgi:hypothetical protein
MPSDDAEFYQFFEQPVAERSMAVLQHALVGTDAPTRTAPFDHWNSLTTKVAY